MLRVRFRVRVRVRVRVKFRVRVRVHHYFGEHIAFLACDPNVLLRTCPPTNGKETGGSF